MRGGYPSCPDLGWLGPDLEGEGVPGVPLPHPDLGWGSPYPDLGWGTPPIWNDRVPPPPPNRKEGSTPPPHQPDEATSAPPPPPNVDRQTPVKNSTYPIPSECGWQQVPDFYELVVISGTHFNVMYTGSALCIHIQYSHCTETGPGQVQVMGLAQ